MSIQEVLENIKKELVRFECFNLTNSNEKVYATGKSRCMADKEFLQVLRPWTEKDLNNFFEFHGYERKFNKNDLGIFCYISRKQLKKGD